MAVYTRRVDNIVLVIACILLCSSYVTSETTQAPEQTTPNPNSTTPTPNPTTPKQTTSNPTTPNPTTTSPTTPNKTTANPTTPNPTTPNPTTSNPTTPNPTTSNPTTTKQATTSPTTPNKITTNQTTTNQTTTKETNTTTLQTTSAQGRTQAPVINESTPTESNTSTTASTMKLSTTVRVTTSTPGPNTTITDAPTTPTGSPAPTTSTPTRALISILTSNTVPSAETVSTANLSTIPAMTQVNSSASTNSSTKTKVSTNSTPGFVSTPSSTVSAGPSSSRVVSSNKTQVFDSTSSTGVPSPTNSPVPDSSSTPGVPSTTNSPIPDNSSTPNVPSSTNSPFPDNSSTQGVPSSTNFPVPDNSSTQGVPSSTNSPVPDNSSAPSVPSSPAPDSSPSLEVPSSTNPSVPESSSVAGVDSSTTSLVPGSSSSAGVDSTTVSTVKPCSLLHCDNGGTCSMDNAGKAVCTCAPGYTGTNCSTNIDECEVNSCKNGATCVDGANTYTCKCPNGFNGTSCENNIAMCNSSPCQNNATCTNKINNYTCTCLVGYTGINCETDIDECASNPCQNNATCNDDVNQYTCICQSGFNGTYCEFNIAMCNSSPCQNNATCANKINNYTCTCLNGYTGINCETDIDECASNPCQNNATCNNAVNEYTCTCVPGFNGTHCEHNIDECMIYVDACQNGGTCKDDINTYMCMCATGWEGKNCTTNIDECTRETDKCNRNAFCNDTEGSYNCTCKVGFTGDGFTCTDILECANETTCKNNATCFEIPGSYRCYCKPGWTGADCSKDINECSTGSSPCHDNATCSNTQGSYQCTCKDGYRGDGHKCIVEVLIKANGTFQHGDDIIVGPVYLPNDIYYYGKPYRTLYISMNGYITLGTRLDQKYPSQTSEEWSHINFPVIAPLWADIETAAEGTGVSYTVITDKSKQNEIQTALNQAQTPSQSVVVTWKQAVPYPVKQNGDQKADFQAVISTVGTQTTLIMFNYDQEEFTWTSTSDKKVVIGISDKRLHDDIKFTSSNFTEAKNKSSHGTKGRWIFNVTSDDKTWADKVRCQDALQKITVNISNSAKTLEPCPCDERQIKLDRRFKLDSSASGVASYVTRIPRTSIKLIQRCNYGSSGYLLRGSPHGGYLDTSTHLDIKTAHVTCCDSSSVNCFMFYEKNPSDTCSTYLAPSWSPSWGDPHITTLDGLNYTFNGRGEYTLFKTNKTRSITVQVRTDLFRADNTDATSFVGIAIKVGDEDKVEILLDRTTETVSIYNNGVLNSTFTAGSVKDLTFGGLIMFNDSQNLIVLADSGLSMQISVGNILDIVVSVPKDHSGSYGLLGNNNGDPADDLTPANSSRPISKTSEEDIFQKFGLTWMIKETESLFTYNITGAGDTESYNFYNNKTIVPSTFIADIANMVENITSYIQEKCGTNINVSDCHGNTACLVDTAASCNVSVGLSSKQSEEKALEEKTKLDHKPPVFTGSPDVIYIGYAVNKTLTLSFNWTNTKLSVSTDVNSYNIDNKSFVWNATKTLRNETMTFSFVATDDMAASSVYSPDIYYCGCEEESQCDFSYMSADGPVKDNFYRARCNCTEDKTGDFCETTVDMCATQVCYPGVTCNSSKTPICGECPAGYEGDGVKCYDANECYTNTDKCDQECINIVGSYKCECRNGYSLNSDNHTCSDVDECMTGNNNNCTETQYCNNVVGSFECLCRPGLSSDGDGNCYEDKISFAGILKFLTDSDNESSVKKAVKVLLEDIFKNSIVEIINVHKESGNRRKRSAEDNFVQWSSDFIIHESKTKQNTTADVKKQFDDYIDELSSNDGTIGVPRTDLELLIPLRVNMKSSKLYSDEDGGVCNFPEKVECDEISTNCTSQNGKVTCSCKSGFNLWENPGRSCKDVDECLNVDSVCKGGTCTNIPGSFICTCPAGYKYDGSMCVDMCETNPCMNGGTCVHGEIENQYLCKCTDVWSGTNCEETNSEAEKLKVIAIAVGASVGGVCLILVCLLCGMYRRNKNRYMGYSSRPYSGLDFDTAYDLQPTSRNKEFPIDDSENSTFSIPRPQVTQNVYESAASSEQGKLDEAQKPLTQKTDEGKDEGHDNPSFLHSKGLEESKRSSKQSSRNPYEYF